MNLILSVMLDLIGAPLNVTTCVCPPIAGTLRRMRALYILTGSLPPG